MRETAKNATFPTSVGHICQEKQDIQICKIWTAHVQFSFSCYLSTIVAQLLFDFIKHAVAHFASFIAPFLSVLTILCFQDTKIC